MRLNLWILMLVLLISPAQVGAAKNASNLHIHAEESLEWDRDKGIYTARGNAYAQRDDTTVHADILRVHYHALSAQNGDNSAQSSTKIARIEAEGRVRLTTTDYLATADKAVYITDQGHFILTGTDLSIKARHRSLEIKSNHSLEYWAGKNIGKASGQASAYDGKNTLQADEITAYFTPGQDHNLGKLHRLQAQTDVAITTPKGQVWATRAKYDLGRNIADVYDNVKIATGQNILYGDQGSIDMNSGLGRLTSQPSGTSHGRVRAIIRLSDEIKGQPAP